MLSRLTVRLLDIRLGGSSDSRPKEQLYEPQTYPNKTKLPSRRAACFALAPIARAVDPPPDGGYPMANTAEGEDALFSLSTGTNNTAGYNALVSNTIGSDNVAVGFDSLFRNTTGSFNTALGEYALIANQTGNSNTSVKLPSPTRQPHLLDQIRQLMRLRCPVRSVASIHDRCSLSRSLDARQAGISR